MLSGMRAREMLSAFILLLYMYFASTASVVVAGDAGGSRCLGAIEAVARATSGKTAPDQEKLVFSTLIPSNDNGVCKLTSTCCSPKAENMLKKDVTQFYQDQLHGLLQNTIPDCINSSLKSDSVAFLEGVKSFMITTMKQLWQEYYVAEFDEVFDGLFNYVENGIATLDLCDLEIHYQNMFFEVYSTSFTALLKYHGLSDDSLSEPDSQACFYDYFMDVHGAAITDNYHRVEQRYNMFLRYLQALATSDEALKDVLHHVLSPECQDSLLRMTHCAQCAGVDEPSVLPCKNFCRNVQQGCLVDLYELGDVYKEFYYVLKDASDVLNEYDPFGIMETLAVQVVKILDDYTYGYQFVANALSYKCGLSFPSQKRSIPMQTKSRQGSKIVPREAVETPLDSVEDTVSCASSVYHLLQTLSTTMCAINNSNPDNLNCWNGTHVGSYSNALAGKGRLLQPENPEIELTTTTGLLYLDAISQLKNVTQQLEECTYNVEGCAIKLCNRTIPSPSDYDLTDEERYAPFLLTSIPSTKCAPTCTPDFCRDNLKEKCSMPLNNTTSVPNCSGECDETICSACYYSVESLPQPRLKGECPTLCPVNANGMACLRNWGRCIRRANLESYGKPSKEEKGPENYKCWRPSCQAVK